MEPIWAVGLMTGTVLDGNIDVALLKTDGETIDRVRRRTRWRPTRKSIRDLLERALDAGARVELRGLGARRSSARPRTRSRARSRRR